jgi:hypothetical protein
VAEHFTGIHLLALKSIGSSAEHVLPWARRGRLQASLDQQIKDIASEKQVTRFEAESEILSEPTKKMATDIIARALDEAVVESKTVRGQKEEIWRLERELDAERKKSTKT